MFDLARWFIRTGLIVVGCALPAAASQAQTLASLPRQGVAAAAEGEARPLAAWVEFCARVPTECATDPAEPAVVQLTPRTWNAIVAVNTRVNGSLKPLTDEEHWGVADRWDIPTDGVGDCEDFQLLKRRLLARDGLPRRAMRMTVVIDGQGEGHAVLMIRTDRGDLVLDNKTNAIRPWFETGYVFVKRESQDRLSWVSLGRATSPTVTANR
jgi:predicted transglutaminase-like cysteine proteinase